MPTPAADPSYADAEGAGERTPHGSTRRTPRWLLLVAGALLVARIGGGLYEARHQPQVVDLIQWRPIAQGPAVALATGKPILYDFTADWCPPCHAMSRELFADPRGAATIEQMFVPVRVLDRTREDGRNAPNVTALQQRYRIEAFPTLVVVAADGREVGRVEGFPGKSAVLRQLASARSAAGAPAPR